MKSEYVIAAFRAFMSDDHDRGMELVNMIEVNERNGGRIAVANRIRQAMGVRPMKMMRLPDGPPEIRLFQAERDLDSLALPAVVHDDVDRLIAEHKHGETLRTHGLNPRSSILLYGPSGNGKTALVNAIANRLGLPLGIIDYGRTIDSHLGETSKKVAEAMKFARKHPCVLLFDEADSLLTARGGEANKACREMDRVVNHLLIELDDRPRNSIIAFASNFDGSLDSAFRRRVEIQLELPAPTEEARRAFMRTTAGRWPFLSDDSIEAMPLRGSYAECEQTVEDAARAWLLENLPSNVEATAA